jgi:hypothetical protein
MNRSVGEHISDLQQKIADLNREMMERKLTLDARNRVESEIRAAEMALSFYRKALELEQQIG